MHSQCFNLVYVHYIIRQRRKLRFLPLDFKYMAYNCWLKYELVTGETFVI